LLSTGEMIEWPCQFAAMPMVCLWHFSDVVCGKPNVRLRAQSEHRSTAARCRLMTQEGHCVDLGEDIGWSDNLTSSG
jgi:hypothetical protein